MKQLLPDVQTLFEPEKGIRGFSPATEDIRAADKAEKGHGLIEKRILTVSDELKEYIDWPYVEQGFKLEREFKQMNTGKVTYEVVYGITSLSAQEAGAGRLLDITRQHWGIESGLHYHRDVTLQEDRSCVRTEHAALTQAVINNAVLGLFARLGYVSAPEARRHFAAHFDEAVNLVLRAST